MSNKQRVAILGGGLGGLTAAYYLSDTPEMRERFEITVYQMGWRLGGKCASGRNQNVRMRIEEHGVHVFSGFYANAFRMLGDCYRELGRPEASPLSTCTGGAHPAFKPHDRLRLMEIHDGHWTHWDLEFESDPSQFPGQRPKGHKLWRDMKEMTRKLQAQYDRLSSEQKQELVAKMGTGGRGTSSETSLGALFDIFPTPKRHGTRRRRCPQLSSICQTLDRLLKGLHAALRAPDRLSDDARHLALLAGLALAIVRGVLKDHILRDGFDVIDKYDFIEWLSRQGASTWVCDSAIVRSLYAAVFAYQPDGRLKGRPRLAAGVALRVLWRTFFGFRGAFLWKMQAGMGEAVVAPLYEVLRNRGVKFEFFHRLDRLELSEDQKSIGRIRLSRQVTLKKSGYQPLLEPGTDDVDVPSWPSEPLYHQLDDVQAAELQRIKNVDHLDLESAWFHWDHDQPAMLEAGRDFDQVVLAISVAALRTVCAELVHHDRKWKQMVESSATTQTQSVQMWLNRTAAQLGSEGIDTDPVVVGYEKPLDSWVGMTQLRERERWLPSDDVRHMAYFVATVVDEKSLEEQLQDSDTPSRQHNVIAQRSAGFLRREFRVLWPGAIVPGSSEFDWNLLVDTAGGRGPDRLLGQYVRANINPSDRYVLSLPGTIENRMRSDESGFANLFLAGDWTRNGLNVGCAEATVMSGMQAARAIAQRRLRIFNEQDPTLPKLPSCFGWMRWLCR